MALTHSITGMSTSPTSPTSPASQEPAVPTVSSPEPKKRRLNPIDKTIVYVEPFTVRVRDSTQDWHRYPDMIRSLGETDAVHKNLVMTFKDLEDHVHGIDFGLTKAQTRIEELEAQLVLADAVGIEQEGEPEGDTKEEDDEGSVISSIMYGRGNGHGGHGNINKTTPELTAMINDRVAEALAANPAGGKSSTAVDSCVLLLINNIAADSHSL
ncbi:hypothetical protein L1987_19109 [Smallanthus sonchifolius]|uniref:Uncharacterized protein n=1 Tax=Smallanthus sonchifolius TaxID=185202 RepID=A0ACB9J2L2_9ASTR|nr:hypothetical protein L1987_19109 [Smallanthus sonchifolius]